MAAYATTRMSSKGQVVIPEEIRDALNLKNGTQFMVVGNKGVVILKTLLPPSIAEFDSLLAHAEKQAKQSKIKKSDIQKAIAKARRKK